MHKKGVPYEAIYQEIGEFEHNFTSWKQGLGRPGIGTRIIERINRPFITLLEEEDDLIGNYICDNVKLAALLHLANFMFCLFKQWNKRGF